MARSAPGSGYTDSRVSGYHSAPRSIEPGQRSPCLSTIACVEAEPVVRSCVICVSCWPSGRPLISPVSVALSRLSSAVTRLELPLASIVPGWEKPSNQPVRSTAYGRAIASSGVEPLSALTVCGKAPSRDLPLTVVLWIVALASGTPS